MTARRISIGIFRIIPWKKAKLERRTIREKLKTFSTFQSDSRNKNKIDGLGDYLPQITTTAFSQP